MVHARPRQSLGGEKVRYDSMLAVASSKLKEGKAERPQRGSLHHQSFFMMAEGVKIEA